MAFVHGKESKVLVSEYDLSSYLSQADLTWETDASETTTYGNDDRTYIVGLRNGTLSFSGYWDTTTSEAIDAVVPSDLGNATALLVSYGPDGLTVGDSVYSVQAFQTSYNVSSPVDGVAAITLDVQGTAKVANAVSLHNLSAVSSDGNSSPVDQSNSSLEGGVGYLHITDMDLPATGSAAFAVQDSPSCTAGVWADLVAFTAITSGTKTSERKAATGGVDRYVRGEWDFTAATTNIFTFAITFDRLTSWSN